MLATFMDATGASRGTRRLRIVAGGLAVMLALGATTAVWIALSGAGDAPPASTYVPPRVPTVWPEAGFRREASAEEVQYRADNLDREVSWRLSPDGVVHAFAASVLGWSDPQVRPLAPGADVPFRWYSATQRRCHRDAECPYLLPGNRPKLRIAVTQPARQGEGGIWSVATVRSSSLRLAATADDPPRSGTIAGTAGRAAGLHTLAGTRWFDGCRVANDIVDDVARPSRFEVVVPDLPPAGTAGCGEVAAGYAYAYAVPAGTVPVGDPLLESAPIVDLTIVPIRAALPPRS